MVVLVVFLSLVTIALTAFLIYVMRHIQNIEEKFNTNKTFLGWILTDISKIKVETQLLCSHFDIGVKVLDDDEEDDGEEDEGGGKGETE